MRSHREFRILESRSLRVEPLEPRRLLAGITGAGEEVLSNVVLPNGNVCDQVLMTGASVTVTANPGQITRVSFLDLDGDIVQAEFSGAGTLTIALDPDSYKGPAEAANYRQPGVRYVSGLASFTIEGSDATTNVSIFSIGTDNAHNKAANPIFADGKTGGNHTADVTRLTIVANPLNPNGSTFGGIRAGNAIFADDAGTVGVRAPRVHVQDVVRIGDIDASGSAVPTLIFGFYSQFGEAYISGGDLVSVNGAEIDRSDSYVYAVNLVEGRKSDGTVLPSLGKPPGPGIFPPIFGSTGANRPDFGLGAPMDKDDDDALVRLV